MDTLVVLEASGTDVNLKASDLHGERKPEIEAIYLVVECRKLLIKSVLTNLDLCFVLTSTVANHNYEITISKFLSFLVSSHLEQISMPNP